MTARQVDLACVLLLCSVAGAAWWLLQSAVRRNR